MVECNMAKNDNLKKTTNDFTTGIELADPYENTKTISENLRDDSFNGANSEQSTTTERHDAYKETQKSKARATSFGLGIELPKKEKLQTSWRSTNVKSKPRMISQARAELSQIVSDDEVDQAAWVSVVQLLRKSAVEEQSNSPRLSGLALMISDVIANTLPEANNETDLQPLERAYHLLMQAFIASNQEKAVFHSFLDAGWQVAPAFDIDHIETILDSKKE